MHIPVKSATNVDPQTKKDLPQEQMKQVFSSFLDAFNTKIGKK